MKKIAIFVATTGGPAQIDRLTPEFAPHSMVCLNRGSDVLPISGDYDDFVKRGSGVIEREFGPFDYASFRLDVTANIGTGKSWQLGVFAAHAVAANQNVELADRETIPDQVIWLTGEVDYDLGVGAVGHIAEKIAASQSLFQKWQEVKLPVLVLVPEEVNFAEVKSARLPEGVRLAGLTNATKIFDHLDLSSPDAPVDNHVPFRRRWMLTAIAAMGIFGVALWAFATDKFGLNSEQAVTKSKNQPPAVTGTELPAPPSVKPSAQAKSPTGTPFSLAVLERRPPPGATCAKVHFSDVPAQTYVITQPSETTVATSSLKDICGLEFVFELGTKAMFIAAALDIKSGSFVRGYVKPAVLSGITEAKGRQAWQIATPRRLVEPLQYRLLVIVSAQPTAAELQWLKKQDDWKQAVNTLSNKGFSVLTWDHRIAQ